MGLRERKKDQTRSQLLDVALKLITTHGYQQTTVNEIAAAVNVSPRTFLRYFPTKDDVVVDWVDDVMAVLPQRIPDAAKENPPVEALMISARDMLTTYQSRGSFLRGIEDLIAASPTLLARKQQRIEALVDEVTATLLEAYGHAHDTLNLTVYAGVIVSMCRATIRSWLASDAGEDILSIFDKAARTIEFLPNKMS